MKFSIYQVDAFAEQPFQGNPAAVVPLESWLPDATMQAIAGENNLAETAFLVKSGDAYDLRWFTPTREVDLCGHATLAAAFVLFERCGLARDAISFQTRSGELLVTRAGGWLTLDFPAVQGVACELPDALAEGLGAAPVAVFQAMDYMAVFGRESDVRDLQPDFRVLSQLDLRGVIVTAPGDEVDFVSRFFAPNFGIDEDPVTGSAHCTLAPYWAGRLGRSRLRARQLSPRTGALQCEMAGERVRISGKAILFLEGTIEIPSDCLFESPTGH
jgi:predicted PhzF superfamily epimerase YddE/YHI9